MNPIFSHKTRPMHNKSVPFRKQPLAKGSLQDLVYAAIPGLSQAAVLELVALLYENAAQPTGLKSVVKQLSTFANINKDDIERLLVMLRGAQVFSQRFDISSSTEFNQKLEEEKEKMKTKLQCKLYINF
jgi:hypothetical protein